MYLFTLLGLRLLKQIANEGKESALSIYFSFLKLQFCCKKGSIVDKPSKRPILLKLVCQDLLLPYLAEWAHRKAVSQGQRNITWEKSEKNHLWWTIKINLSSYGLIENIRTYGNKPHWFHLVLYPTFKVAERQYLRKTIRGWIYSNSIIILF